ncbi:hypothetical protein OF83DRAFT_1095835 [Amylostereum chailletii]|nr:hypothetical protein OF83DRAFT_1095835 [Amylostereum chailletii]
MANKDELAAMMLHVSHVCRHWRTITLECSVLWSKNIALLDKMHRRPFGAFEVLLVLHLRLPRAHPFQDVRTSHFASTLHPPPARTQ